MAAKTGKSSNATGTDAGGWARKGHDPHDARRVPVGRPIRHIPPRSRRVPGRR
jgi:hypothetical protein